MAGDPLPLSVVTVCKNNEATLGGVLESVRGIAGEIVALDSGSRDGTMALLRAHGARVVEQPWLGHVRQKQAALAAATLPWILHLDSDEPVLPDLAAAIRGLIEREDPAVAAARVRRVVWYRGRPLEHAWQPEWRLRLVRRGLVASGLARWVGRDPHDRLEVAPAAGRVVDLAGVLRHDSFESFAGHLAKQLDHGRTAAASAFEAGVRSSPARLALRPAGAFLKQVVLKEAWRDGVPGWLAAASAAAGTLMKHVALLELAHGGPEGAPGGGTVADRAKGTGASYGSRHEGRAGGASDTAASPSTEPAALRGPRPHEDHVTDDTRSEEQTDERREAPALDENGEPIKKKKRRRRRRKKTDTGRGDGGTDAAASESAGDAGDAEGVDAEAADEEAGDADEPREDRVTEVRAVKPLSDEAKRHVFDVETTFASLGLKGEILEALAEAGWEHPTKIQAALIPVALTGRDVLGQAKTGSGKTAAFGLPLLQMAEKGEAFGSLVLAPTRELAVQIRDDINALGKRTGLRVTAVYGGQKIHTQAAKLEAGPEIIVGTPGRVMDMHERGHLNLKEVRVAVLDEVDRMFDIGFREDIRRILGLCTKVQQTIFVSATISEEIERLARKHMNEPQRLTVASGSLTVEMVQQHHIPVQPWDKRRMLAHVLTHEEPDLTIVFCRMKRTVDDVVKYLDRKGIQAHALHGDMSQGKRNQTMKSFRKGTLNVLVASDLASRGLDVEGITHVVNYDLPEDPDIYVHRIGRTARAGREGIAWSLVTPEQGSLLTEIELLINAEIPKKEYADFEPRERPADWRDEPKGGRPTVEIEVAPPKNRYEDAPQLPAADAMSQEELAKKFPGGVVPKGLPKKRLRGRVRTTRGR